MNQYTVSEVLSRFFPVESVDKVRELVEIHRFQLKFRRGRASKLGDFRPAANGKPPQITINADLNIYACLLVFLHELAHLVTWREPAQKQPPHSKIWKEAFGILIRQFVGAGYFHPALKDTLLQYSYNVKATGIGNEILTKELSFFNKHDDNSVLLADLPVHSHFATKSGRLFRKADQIRKRFRCTCLDNQKTYLFHPMARVHAVHPDNIKQSQK